MVVYWDDCMVAYWVVKMDVKTAALKAALKAGVLVAVTAAWMAVQKAD